MFVKEVYCTMNINLHLYIQTILPSPVRALVHCAMTVDDLRRLVLSALELEDDDGYQQYTVYISDTTQYGEEDVLKGVSI